MNYQILKPNKKNQPRIKITHDYGYDSSGKRQRKTKTVVLDNLLEATILEAVVDFEKSLGEYKPKKEKIRFKDFSSQYLEHVYNTLKIKTFLTYQSYLKSISRFFDKMLLQNITSEHVKAYLKQQTHCITEKFNLIRSMLNVAIEWNLLETNPCNGIKLKQKARYKKPNYYNKKQIEALLEVLPHLNIKHALQIKIALYSGLRMSEIVGLTLDSIDTTQNVIHVRATLQYDKIKKQFFLGATKTNENRDVFIPDFLVKELADYIEVKRKQLQKENVFAPIELLFSNVNGKPNYPDRMTHQWKMIIKKYHLEEITFHGLRHTYASYLISKNVNVKIIQQQLGHKNIQETLNTYSHIEADSIQQSVSVFDDFRQ